MRVHADFANHLRTAMILFVMSRTLSCGFAPSTRMRSAVWEQGAMMHGARSPQAAPTRRFGNR
jgi:hypothetical protein